MEAVDKVKRESKNNDDYQQFKFHQATFKLF
jgi:hypothetical protein